MPSSDRPAGYPFCQDRLLEQHAVQSLIRQLHNGLDWSCHCLCLWRPCLRLWLRAALSLGTVKVLRFLTAVCLGSLSMGFICQLWA